MSEEERVTTYSGLVRVLRERIASYVAEGVERARALREAVRLIDEPVEVEGSLWRAMSEPQVAVASGLGYSFGNAG